MAAPKISIVIPVYNSAKYLRECLDSLVCQIFTDFEVVAVDDGSVDESPEILDEYVARDTRFSVIHKVNGGVSAARNDGLDKACGDYVLFVDSDDWLEKNALELMMEAAARDDADVVITDHFTWREKVAEMTNRFFARDFVATTLEEIQKIQQTVLYRGYSPYPSKTCGYMFSTLWTKLIRRSLLLEYKIRFSEVLKLYEDGLVALQVFNAAKVVAYRSCTTYHYRILNNSLCHINETRLVKDCGCILEELQKYMRASRCDNILGDAFYARTLFLTKKMALRSFFARGAQGSFLKRFRAFKEILLTEPYRTAVKRAASLKLVGNEKNYGRLMGHGLFFMTALMYECRARLLRR